MAMALATFPFGAARGEVDACLAGDARGLAGCFAVGDLAAAGWAAGLTTYGTTAACDLVLLTAGLAAAIGLTGAATLADPPLAAAFVGPALPADNGLDGAALPLPVAALFSGLTGAFVATFLAAGFGGALATTFLEATLPADFAAGLEITFFGAAFFGAVAFFKGAFTVAAFLAAAFFGAAFAGAAFLASVPFLTAPLPTTGFLAAAVLADAIFLFATGATGFLAATVFPVTLFLATATGFLTFLLAAGLLATGLAAGLEAAMAFARVLAAATTFLLALPAAFPFCAFAAVEPCVVFAISLHRCGRGGRVL